MFAILIAVSVTLSSGRHYSFNYTSSTHYAETACKRRADEMAQQISSRLAQRIRPRDARVKPGCVLSAVRPA